MKRKHYNQIRAEAGEQIILSTLYVEENLFGEKVACYGFSKLDKRRKMSIYLVAGDLCEQFVNWHIMTDDELFADVKNTVCAMEIGVIETTVKVSAYFYEKGFYRFFAQCYNSRFGKLELMTCLFSTSGAQLSSWQNLRTLTKEEKKEAEMYYSIYQIARKIA